MNWTKWMCLLAVIAVIFTASYSQAAVYTWTSGGNAIWGSGNWGAGSVRYGAENVAGRHGLTQAARSDE